MTKKVKDLSKELKIPSEQILEQLHNLYVEAEDEESVVDDKIAELIKMKLGPDVLAQEEAEKEKARKKEEEKKKAEKAKLKKKKKKEAEKKAKQEAKKKAEEEAKKKAEEEKKKEQEEKEKKKKSSASSKKSKKGSKPGIEIVQKAQPEESVDLKAQPEEEQPEDVREERVKEKAGKKEKKSEKKKPEKKSGSKKKEEPSIEIVEKVSKPKGKRSFRKRTSGRPTPKPAPAKRKTKEKVSVAVPISVRKLGPRINTKPNDIIQFFMSKGALVNINQKLEEDMVREVMDHFGYELEIPKTIEKMEQELFSEQKKTEGKKEVKGRAPIVTFMGHVDHGKTSLLDYIRETMVTKSEKGGITQHIGAYKVETAKGSVTFLDTPGHEAFTAMRARGANITDVVVLVVAANDGIMPQTKEAIDHARAAEVPIVVAINKCDLPTARPDNVKSQLQQEGLAPEDWGGETITVNVSAETGEGVDDLVEMLMLESEMLDLKATHNLKARGVVIEGKKTPGEGIVATFLVRNGTLYTGDIVFCGTYYGKVKAMKNFQGDRVDKAPPATPVEVLGLQGVPEAGDEFFVVKDEKKARTLTQLKQKESRKRKMASQQRVTLEDLHERILEGEMKELKIILKADVQGSMGALKESLLKLSTEEVKVNIIHEAVGNVSESDVMLAMVSDAIILGFHVRTAGKAAELAKKENIDIHHYDIIYKAIEEVRAGMEGLLEPEEKEVFQGSAEVREIFSSSSGNVAGCAVIKGVIHRNDNIRIKRKGEIIHEGKLKTLKRFKNDAKDVKEGFECGITVTGFDSYQRKDLIEAYQIVKVARKLEG